MAHTKPHGTADDQELGAFTWTFHADSFGNFSHENSVSAIGRCQLRELKLIRQQLEQLNRLLHCSNFVGIPTTLRTIARQTKKAKRKKATREAA